MTTIPTMEGAEGGFPTWEPDGWGSVFAQPLDVADVGLPPIYGSTAPAGPGANADDAARREAQARIDQAERAIKPQWRLWLDSVWLGIGDTLSLTDPATRPAGNVGVFDSARALASGISSTAESATGAVTATADAIRGAAPLLIYGLGAIVLWRAFKWKAGA